MREALPGKLELPTRGTYVLAVSGGVDSVVLLDILAKSEARRVESKKSNELPASDSQLIIAHVDHGIRPDSFRDALFVIALAERYGLPFEFTALRLGPGASEERARRERYAYLHWVAKKHEADGLLTAHHADDVVETMVMNIIRGTGWRGLCSLRSNGGIIRPLINLSKVDILEYAARERLEWVEDYTNAEDDYLRNRIRHYVLPACLAKDAEYKQKMLRLWRGQTVLKADIEAMADELYEAAQSEGGGLARAMLEGLDAHIGRELLRRLYAEHGVRQTRPQYDRALDFAGSARNGKRFSLGADAFLEVRAGNLVVRQS